MRAEILYHENMVLPNVCLEGNEADDAIRCVVLCVIKRVFADVNVSVVL